MKSIVLSFSFMVVLLIGCETTDHNPKSNQFTRLAKWKSDSSYVEFVYKGPEFIQIGKYYRDEAHLTSTKFTHIIGPFLKSNFNRKNYLKLDLSNLKVSFKGNPEFRWPSGKRIEYKISVPIIHVSKRKDAMTSIEHRGTWIKDYDKCSDENFSAWKGRVAKISSSKVESQLIEKDGFRELWLQWR